MKSWTAALAAAVFAAFLVPAAAQNPPPAPADMTPAQLLKLVQTDKKGLVTRNITLTPDESKVFWPLYVSFQKDLDRVQNRRNRAVIDYVAAGPNVTAANAKRLVGEVMAAEEEDTALRKVQFAKLMKALPADKAARYMQIENKIRAVLMYESARAIPLAQ